MPMMTPAFWIPLALALAVAMTMTAVLRLGLGAERGRTLAGLGLTFGALAGWISVRGLPTPPTSLADIAVYGLLGALVVGGVLEGAALRMRWLAWPIAAYALLCLWVGLGSPVMVVSRAMGIGAVLLAVGWAVVLFRLYRVAAREDAEAWALIASLGAGLALVAWASGNHAQIIPGLGLAFAAVGAAVVALPFKLPFGVAALLGSGGAVMWIVQALVIPRPTLTAPLAILACGLFAGATARRLPMGARMGPLWSAILALVPAILAALLAVSLPF